MEVEEAALCLCLMKHQELDTNTSTILRKLIQSTETRKFLETRPVPPKRMLPATTPLPRPQIDRRENRNKIGSINENENKIEKGNRIDNENTIESGNGAFEPNPDFIEKLNRGVIILNKLPLLGKAIDGIVLPRLPPIDAIQGQISNCSAPFEKQLTRSDLRTDQARFNFCRNQVELVLKRFMTDSEYNKVVSKNKEGLEVVVYDRAGRTYEMKLKLWAEKMHVLSTGWNEFCEKNKLEIHLDWVTVWMFRHREIGKPCFAMVARRFPTEDLIGKTQKNGNENKKRKIE